MGTTDLLVGQTLGRYRLEALIAVGGMSRVYRAVDTGSGRVVAVKVVKPALAADDEYRQRFLREVDNATKLRHRNIVPVIGAREQDARLYLVMEYVEGGATLSDQFGRNLSIAEACAFLGPIADALDYAHAHGIVHRDVKPSNILIAPDGKPLLSDFGIATAAGDSSMTTTGRVLGTPEYAAPERFSGAKADRLSDLYSLGVVLYQAVTSRLPFEMKDNNMLALINRIGHSPPPSPRQLNPKVSPYVEAVLLQALAKEPSNRYPTGLKLADALHTALTTSPEAPTPVFDGRTRVPPPTIVTTPPSRPSRGRTPSIIGGLVALCAAILVCAGIAAFARFGVPGVNATATAAGGGTGATMVAVAEPTFTPVPPTPAPTLVAVALVTASCGDAAWAQSQLGGLAVGRVSVSTDVCAWRWDGGSTSKQCPAGWTCTLFNNGTVLLFVGDGQPHSFSTGTFRYIAAYPENDAVHDNPPCQLLAKERAAAGGAPTRAGNFRCP